MRAWIFCWSSVLLLSCGSGDDGPSGNKDRVPCCPNNTATGYDIACLPVTQVCVHDYAGASPYPRPNSCQPMIAGCENDRSCACALQRFRCGITTTCSQLPSGLLRLVCQPD